MRKHKLTLKDVFLKPIINDTSHPFNYTNYNDFMETHPLIIFYDDENNVYFLQMRGAEFLDQKTQQWITKSKLPNFSFEVNNVKFDYEYTLNKQPKGLPYKKSYVDTSTIFKMKKDDFINYFNIKDINDFNATNILDSKDVINILFQTGWLMAQRPPQVVFNQLEIKNNQIINNVKYVEPKLIVDYSSDTPLQTTLKNQMRQFQNDPKIQHEVFLKGLEIKHFCEDLQTKIMLGISIKPSEKKNKTLHEKYLEDI